MTTMIRNQGDTVTKRTTEANFVTSVKHVTRTPLGGRKRGVRALASTDLEKSVAEHRTT